MRKNPEWCELARALVAMLMIIVAPFSSAASTDAAAAAMHENRTKLANMQPGFRALAEGRPGDAVTLWRPIADTEFAPAQFALGTLYEQGKGVPQDLSVALRELWAAELNGLKRAKARRMALQERLPPEAVAEVAAQLRQRLLLRALNVGGKTASALAELAAATNGGTPRDLEDYYVWKTLATALGNAGAAKARDEAAANFDAPRLLELQALASGIFTGSVPANTRASDYPGKATSATAAPVGEPTAVGEQGKDQSAGQSEMRR
jgi:TPR repeat protein